MHLSTEIVVIGGGVAGFAAAVEARAKGKKVILVSKTTGATALSSGAIDLADSSLRTPKDSLSDYSSIEQNIREIIRREPFHPYALLSHRFGEEAFLDFLRYSLRQVMRALPLKLVGNLETNRYQVTPLGTIKPTAIVQNSMSEGNILSMNQAKILVVGIRGFAPFHSRFIKESLLEMQAHQPVPYFQFVGNKEVEVPGLEGKSSLTAIEIAERLDHEENFVRFGQSIVSYVKGKVYTHLLLPPVMGIVNHDLIILALQKITGLKVAETLALPMSIPGYRLIQAIGRELNREEVEQVQGTVRHSASEGEVLKNIIVKTETEEVSIEAKSFILATGKYIAGGVNRQKRFEEIFLDLPLFIEDKGVKDKNMLSLTSSITQRQPFLKIGLRVSGSLNPLDDRGVPLFKNLFAAGSILGGYDYVHDRSGGGVAIATGTYAGRLASENY